MSVPGAWRIFGIGDRLCADFEQSKQRGQVTRVERTDCGRLLQRTCEERVEEGERFQRA
jgi:hypothetical protein